MNQMFYRLSLVASLIVLLNGCSLHEYNLRQEQLLLHSYGTDVSIDDLDRAYPEWRRLERNKTQPSN